LENIDWAAETDPTQTPTGCGFPLYTGFKNLED
jgi:hypothetical protein